MKRQSRSAVKLGKRRSPLVNTISGRADQQQSEMVETAGQERRAQDDSNRQHQATDAVDGDDDDRGVVYLGHLPYGFFESQMLSFFSQFGEVSRLHLSRNKRTGRSQHCAFIEFKDQQVAQIVADSMHRYLMFGHTLTAHLVPKAAQHPNLFKHCNRSFRQIPYTKIAKERHNRSRTAGEQKKRIKRLLEKELKKRKLLEKLKINFSFPGYGGSLDR